MDLPVLLPHDPPPEEKFSSVSVFMSSFLPVIPAYPNVDDPRFVHNAKFSKRISWSRTRLTVRVICNEYKRLEKVSTRLDDDQTNLNCTLAKRLDKHFLKDGAFPSDSLSRRRAIKLQSESQSLQTR